MWPFKEVLALAGLAKFFGSARYQVASPQAQSSMERMPKASITAFRSSAECSRTLAQFSYTRRSSANFLSVPMVGTLKQRRSSNAVTAKRASGLHRSEPGTGFAPSLRYCPSKKRECANLKS